MKNKKIFAALVALGLLHLTFTFFLQNILDPISYSFQNLFITELLGITFTWPKLFLYFFSLANLILLYLVSRSFFTSSFSLIPAMLYTFSPWGSYLVVTSSLYIYLTFLILLIFYSLLLLRGHKKRLAKVLLILTTLTAFYDSFLLSLILPIIFILLITTKIINLKELKIPLICITILLLPLFFIFFKTPNHLKNTLNNEIRLFSDPGLLNTVNSYQGASRDNGYGNLAKLSENKYVFFTEYMFLKYAKSLVPSTFFTSQEKLLGFSFTSPMLLGFLIPFIWGFYLLITNPALRLPALISTLLVMPAVLSKQIVDLNRLVIFSPVVIMITSYGLIYIWQQKKKVALWLTIFLVLIQLFITIIDIKNREKERFLKTFGQSYDLGKQ